MQFNMTKEEFKTKAIEVHGNRYNYDRIISDNLEPYDKIPIVCENHGVFFQTVYEHLCGKGCFECFKSENLILKK